MDIIRKLIAYSLKKVLVKAMFILTAFEIMLFKCRLVLTPSQWGTGSERVKFLVKKLKKVSAFVEIA